MSDQEAAVRLAVAKGYTISKNGIIYNSKGYTLEGCLNTTGYRYITIRMDSYFGFRKCGKAMVHRIIGYLKFGDRVFDPKLQIRHLDGNKLNNSYSNISIGSPSDNRFDIPASERLRLGKLAAKARRKFTDAEIVAIRTRHNDGISYKYLMEEYNSAKSTLSYIINSKTYVDVVNE